MQQTVRHAVRLFVVLAPDAVAQRDRAATPDGGIKNSDESDQLVRCADDSDGFVGITAHNDRVDKADGVGKNLLGEEGKKNLQEAGRTIRSVDPELLANVIHVFCSCLSGELASFIVPYLM